MALPRFLGLLVLLPPAALAERGFSIEEYGDAPLEPELPFEPSAEETKPVELMHREALAPYFGDGPLKDAKAAFDRHEWGAVRRLLERSEASPPVRFLRALASLRALDFAAAGPEFEALADDWSAMRDHCLVHAGRAFEGLDDWRGAERVYSRVSAASRLSGDGQLGLARALRHQRRWTEAIDATSTLAESPRPPWGRDLGAEALAELADIHAARGDRNGERDALLALWADHPLARVTARRAIGLGDVAAEARVRRAEAFIEAHRNRQGAAEVEPLLSRLSPPDPLGCRAHLAAGRAARKSRDHTKALRLLRPVASTCQAPELRAAALLTLGQSEAVVPGRGAAETYLTLAHSFPEHSQAPEALFLGAEALLAEGRSDEAAKVLSDLAERYPAHPSAAEGLFKLFWVSWRQGRLELADGYLEELERRWEDSADTYELERAQYWRARVLEARELPTAAAEMLFSLAEAHPTTYYGLLAAERLHSLDADAHRRLLAVQRGAPHRQDPFPLDPGPLKHEPSFQSAVELLRLGFGELVPLEVLAVERSTLPPNSLRLLVQVLSLSGETRAAHGLARLWLRGDLSGPVTPQTRPVFEIAYPLAFRDLVTDSAAEADQLDPYLLQALMREESALDPKALSWAGALGLCQLMPATAREVSTRLKLPPPSPADLLEPQLNVRLGARFLADVLDRAGGTTQYALAGYNAGEGSVRRWRREQGPVEPDVFVEQIPLQETRGYVKRVLRSYNTYKLLYAPQEQPRTVVPSRSARSRPVG